MGCPDLTIWELPITQNQVFGVNAHWVDPNKSSVKWCRTLWVIWVTQAIQSPEEENPEHGHSNKPSHDEGNPEHDGTRIASSTMTHRESTRLAAPPRASPPRRTPDARVATLAPRLAPRRSHTRAPPPPSTRCLAALTLCSSSRSSALHRQASGTGMPPRGSGDMNCNWRKGKQEWGLFLQCSAGSNGWDGVNRGGKHGGAHGCDPVLPAMAGAQSSYNGSD
jgi:hypothetical protein